MNNNKKAPVGNLYNLDDYRNIHAEQINNMTNISDENLLWTADYEGHD